MPGSQLCSSWFEMTSTSGETHLKSWRHGSCCLKGFTIIRRNSVCLMMSIGALLMTGYAQSAQPNACPVQGQVIQWVADYCMFKLETVDEIAASDCIADEIKASFKSACVAKAHYKRALCELTIKAGSTPGPIERCVADRSFMGSTVRRGGVGARQQGPTK